MFVIPVAPLVRDPISKKPLPPEGREVPESSYWLRRLRCGDVRLSIAAPADSVVLAD